MNFLDSLERALERAVNGAFARTFQSGVQPVEISGALRKEMDTAAAVVAQNRILVPSEYTVTLSPSDYDRIVSIGPPLIDELTRLMNGHAKKQGYQFAGSIRLTFSRDSQLRVGVARVASGNSSGNVTWTPVLEIDGKVFRVTKQRTVIGRAADVDVVIDDASASRRHVEILWDGKRAQASDLGSTNGTLLDGIPLTVAPLGSDATITIGKTHIVFRVVPESSMPSRAGGQP